MLIRDIILEMDGEETKRFDSAMQLWIKTSGPYYSSDARSYIVARAKAIFGAGGMSPMDAISNAAEEYSAKKRKTQDKKQSKDQATNTKMTYGRDKDEIEAEPKRKRGGQAGNKNAYKGGPANPFQDVDMSTMATSLKTGKTLGDRLSGKLQGLMDIGKKYRARTPK
jgi:hypothetical protein